MKVKWIGPTGNNPQYGLVHVGKMMDLTGDKLKKAQDLGLVETAKKKGE